jgi:hypothetical protein
MAQRFHFETFRNHDTFEAEITAEQLVYNLLERHACMTFMPADDIAQPPTIIASKP